MDIFNIIFTVLLVLGFIFIIMSLVYINKENDSKNGTPIGQVDSSIKKVRTAIDQADLAIDDLNLLSEELFRQFDEKQKELLFLYDAIEKKKSMVDSFGKVDIQINEKIENNFTNQSNNNLNMDMSKLPPSFPKIKELFIQGKSITEIAKILNMGQGEVSFILEIGKDFL